MHPILIKNADVYAPEHLGTRDIFLAGGKIVAMAEKLDVTLPDLEVIDAAGYIVAPGLVDQHIHITGGGGEGGWHSRCPELVFSELVKAGVTTFLGVSGTDSMTRSVENLLAKVRGLKNEGASGWMWTSNYAYPVTTITKDVRTDMLAIPEVLGVKIALGDHRSSFPNQHEIMQILADVRVSGMLTGKTGFLHVHLGDFPYSFDIFDECVAQGMPIKHIRPTHVARHPEVFRRACEFAKKGGFIDITLNAKKVVYCGTFTAKGLKTECKDGKLVITQEGAKKKFVKQVEHITFSGDYANEVHQPVLYITERCVFELRPEGITLIEIAPGIDLQTQILDQMEFEPKIAYQADGTIKLMDERIFHEELMGLTIE